MAKEQLAVAELIMNLILGKTENVSRVEFFPQKKKFPEDLPYEQPFPRATPESQGVSSRLLSAMIRELYSSKEFTCFCIRSSARRLPSSLFPSNKFFRIAIN